MTGWYRTMETIAPLLRDEDEARQRGLSVEQLRLEREEREAELRRAGNRNMAVREDAKRALGERFGLGIPCTICPTAGKGRDPRLHIVVDEEFHRGEIHRRAGQRLCVGKSVVREQAPGLPSQWQGDPPMPLDAEVTCPKCRQMAGLDEPSC